MPSIVRSLVLVVTVAIIASIAPASVIGQDDDKSSPGLPTLTGRISTAIASDGVELGGDPLGSAQYVRESIAFEPYEGVLKGDRGTYLTGAGNGADQALLLAALIGAADATTQVRFASCELDSSTYAQLSTATRADSTSLLIDEAEAIAAAIKDPELRAAILDLAARRDVIRGEASDATDELASALEGSGYPWDIAPPSSNVDTVEHVWLQANVADAWIDLDTTSEGGARPCEASEHFDRLPESMVHGIEISVVAEARNDGQLVEGELLSAAMPLHELSTARVALVFGEPMGLLAPSTEAGFGLNPDPDAGLTSFTPILRIDGRSTIGTPVAFPALGSFVADEVDDALGGALDLFAELPGEEVIPAEEGDADGVTAIWLDIRLTAPGEETVSLRSEVLDRIGVAARADGTESSSQLAPLHEADGNYVALSTLWQIGLLLGQTRTTEGALDGRLDPQTVDGLSGHLDALLRTFPALRADLGAETDAPAIVLAGLGPTLTSSGVSAESLILDALHVPSRVPLEANQAARDAHATVAAEEMLMVFTGGDIEESLSVGAVMRAASEAATPLVLRTWGDHVGITGASPRAVARMTSRLEDGGRLLVPASAVMLDGVSTTAWWSVDPLTGIVRDEHENGRHSTADTAVGETRTVSFMNHLRRFGCRVARPVALAATILYVSSGAGASPLHEVLEEVVQAAEAEAERRAEREVAEKAACAGS